MGEKEDEGEERIRRRASKNEEGVKDEWMRRRWRWKEERSGEREKEED